MFFPCELRRLPPALALKAAEESVRLYAANAPSAEAIAAFVAVALVPPTPLETVFMTDYRWGDRVDLSVQFLRPSEWTAESKRLILDSTVGANAWGRWANVRFRETSQTGDVRVSFWHPGYWSVLGNQARVMAPGDPTLNLQNFNLNKDAAGHSGATTIHEFGHAIGLHHAHLHPDVQRRVDPQKTIAYFRQTYGWDEGKTRANVLTTPANAWLTPTAELKAVMQYGLPGSCTYDGKPIETSFEIVPDEGEAVNRFYPGPVLPRPGVYPRDLIVDPYNRLVRWWTPAGKEVTAQPFPTFGGDLHVAFTPAHVAVGAGAGGGPHGVVYEYETGRAVWERNPVPGFKGEPTGCHPAFFGGGRYLRWSGQGGLVVDVDTADWRVTGTEARYGLARGVNVRSMVV